MGSTPRTTPAFLFSLAPLRWRSCCCPRYSPCATCRSTRRRHCGQPALWFDSIHEHACSIYYHFPLPQIPTMHHLRHLNFASVLCTAPFVVIVMVECITDGELPCLAVETVGDLRRATSCAAGLPHLSSAGAPLLCLRDCAQNLRRCSTLFPVGMRIDRRRVSHDLVPGQSTGQHAMEVRADCCRAVSSLLIAVGHATIALTASSSSHAIEHVC